MRLPHDEAVARSLSVALDAGDLAGLRALLEAHPGLAGARVVAADGARTPLHLLADWPGHRPHAAEAARLLVAAGADVDAPFEGAHAETALHWAASSGDLPLLEALLALGAHRETAGGVIGGGTALADAVAFGQWEAARSLVAAGAVVTLWQAAALGLPMALHPLPSPAELDNALWCAAHGGQREAAAQLVSAGADPRRRLHDGLTAAGAARRAGALELAAWLEAVCAT